MFSPKTQYDAWWISLDFTEENEQSFMKYYSRRLLITRTLLILRGFHLDCSEPMILLRGLRHCLSHWEKNFTDEKAVILEGANKRRQYFNVWKSRKNLNILFVFSRMSDPSSLSSLSSSTLFLGFHNLYTHTFLNFLPFSFCCITL